MKLRILGLFLVFCFLFVFTPIARAQSSTGSCVAIAGDSVEFGDVVYEQPNVGFPVVNTGHVATLLRGLLPSGTTVIDASSPATSLTQGSRYSDSQVVNSGCQYVVVGPWVNDMGQGQAGPTITAIGQMISDITNKNPSVKILLVNYYIPHPSSFAPNIWPNFKNSSQIPSLVGSFNSQIQSSFGSNSKVAIIDVSDFGISFMATDYNGLKADGVHLSGSGKQELANRIARVITSSSSGQPVTNNVGTAGATGTGLPFAQCVGTGLARYLNIVVDGAGNLSHVRLLSPVFNITDAVTPHIIDAMKSAGANFSGLSGLAANTYNLNGTPAYKYYTDNFKQFASSLGKSVVFTEYGSVDLSKNPGNTSELSKLTSDFADVSSDSSIIGALFFNAMGTNSDKNFAGFILSSGNIQSITSRNPSKAGVNSATFVMGGGAFSDKVKTYDSSLKWDLEILNSPGDLQAAIDAVNKANAGGLRPVLRLCASGNTCAFSDPQVLITFLGNLNSKINSDVWVVAGSNEPETEKWVTPTCESGVSAGVSPKSYDVSKEIPCDQTTPREFHSLRPYPASPCYKKVEETALMCSNDLIVKKTFHVTPNDNCSAPDANGNFSCTYQYTGVQDVVSIDLTNAKLPIAGNTEDVPNATWASDNTNANNLTAEQRVNNYVSWYLNGVVDRAEEDFSRLDPKYLINFSGPINKLLPWDWTFADRLTTILAGNQVPASGKEQDKQHDQIAGCDLYAGGLANLAAIIPCYISNSVLNDMLSKIPNDLAGIVAKLTIGKADNRLTDWNRHTPPQEGDYKNFADYWKNYLSWRGNICSPSLLGKFYFCAGLSSAFQIWSLLYPYIPQSSTEDRVGQVITDTNNPQTGLLDQTIQLKEGQGNGGTVTNVSFTPDNSSHNLYFSHMQEDAQLAKVLQSTFAAKSTVPDNWEGQLQSAIGNQSIAHTFNTYGCVKQEIRTNPGDNLYGNVDRVTADGKTDKKITGTLKYDATFTCLFTPQTDQTCVKNGGSNCTTVNECSQDIYTSLAIYTKTPKSYEIWQRLVGCDPTDPDQPNCLGSGGSMGTFKRFFPKPGLDSVLTNIKDIPAATTVSYNSDADTKAGKTGQDGAQASLYFAHLGSLEEYFLQGLQTALRPKGVSCQNTSSATGQSGNSSVTTRTDINGGVVISTVADPANLVASAPSEYGQKTCDWASSKGLSYAMNANFFAGGKPLGLFGTAGQISNNPMTIKAKYFYIDSTGPKVSDVAPKNLGDIKFIVTGVPYDSFQPPHDGPESRTALGLNGSNLYLMALKQATPLQVVNAMQNLGVDSNHFIMLDGDTSTSLCNGSTPLVGGTNSVAVSIGIKGGSVSDNSNIGSSNCVGSLLGQTPTNKTLQCIASDNVNVRHVLNAPDAFISDKTIALALQVAKVTCTPAEILIGMMAKESRGLANGNTPYMGNPNEVGNRNCVGANYSCGAYGFGFIDMKSQFQHRPAAMNACLTSIGLPPASINNLPDQRILGVSLCAAAVEFWDGMVCSPSQRACDGNEHALSSIAPGQIENSALEFHAKDCDPSQSGKNRDFDGAWKYYDQFIKIYAPDVARVRAQCTR